jgi:hypothetical protein
MIRSEMAWKLQHCMVKVNLQEPGANLMADFQNHIQTMQRSKALASIHATYLLEPEWDWGTSLQIEFQSAGCDDTRLQPFVHFLTSKQGTS